MKNEDIKLLDIGLEDYELKKFDANKIKYKKQISKILAESRQKAKLDTCYFCGKATSSICKSHFVPAFCLRNIAVNGEVNYSNTLINVPGIDFDKGVNEAGTFRLICRDCDSKIFSDYENPENYVNEPSPKMIAQIAMKNYLKMISKRLFEIVLHDDIGGMLPISSGLLNQQKLVDKLDLDEYQKGFEKAKRLSSKTWSGEYYIFYYEKLDYVVPIAFQGAIVLISDLKGEIINDIYNLSPDYHTKEVHICVFPLQDSSIIMMFIDANDKRYKSFYKQFRKLKFDDKLALTNYIIFLYSEDVFFSKKIPQEVITDKRLIAVTRRSQIAVSSKPFGNAIEKVKQNFDLTRWQDIPNLLINAYAIDTKNN
ncbi:MAG TPA: hypothetical protein PKN87_09135 [Syntrophomonadaceae bacterium]|nr:hypothetical protein [Syntrophomonadaceae bacterium]